MKLLSNSKYILLCLCHLSSHYRVQVRKGSLHNAPYYFLNTLQENLMPLVLITGILTYYLPYYLLNSYLCLGKGACLWSR